MKRYLSVGIVFVLAMLLTSCSYYRAAGPNVDLTCETWSSHVDSNPAKWTVGADSWFLEGGTNQAQEMDQNAPYMAAMSTMMVRASNCITKVKVSGQFQVQLFGTSGDNSIYIYGPNAAVRGVAVKMVGDTLILRQVKNAPTNMGCVIVRIGIRNLSQLSQMGSGRIEGRGIRSNNLRIISCGCGNVYLGGSMNLTSVVSSGKGSVSVFGAITPMLGITTSGAGSVNVSGNVGINCIVHHGCGDINIIGANSDGLRINADGKGKIGINGRLAINEINAKDNVCVYAYYLNTDTLKVYVTDNARVGLAGCDRELYVDAGKCSRFEGRYLYTNDAYVRAHDAAHINVTAANKVFASATQNGSVYYFGSPNNLSQFFRDYGVVMPILGDKSRRNSRSYCPYYRRQHPIYKDS